jgi:hypothetical protein
VFTEKIEKITDLSRDAVIALLKSGTADKFEFFPDRIMTGEINDDTIDSVINPPAGFSDPFKSRVTGKMTSDNRVTSIQLTVKPSWTVIIFTTIWLGLILKMLYENFGSPDAIDFRDVGIMIFFSLVPFGFGKLKLTWDRRRLKKWLDKIIANSALH